MSTGGMLLLAGVDGFKTGNAPSQATPPKRQGWNVLIDRQKLSFLVGSLHAGLQTIGGLRWFKPIMALNVKDKETEKLAAEIATLTGESEEEVVRQSLRERRKRLRVPAGGRQRPRSREELLHFMETEIWPLIPEDQLGRSRMTKAERAKLLGYGPDED